MMADRGSRAMERKRELKMKREKENGMEMDSDNVLRRYIST